MNISKLSNLFRISSVITMSDRAQVISSLVKRLDESEKKIRFLKIEVANIRKELSTLTGNEESESNDLLRKRRTDTPDNPIRVKKSKGNFMENDDFVIVYTDGACPNNGYAKSKAGIGVWWGDNHPLNVSKPGLNRQTNNAAEIQACTEACRIASENGIAKLLIRTDSQFVINCMTKWIKNWKRNNWKTANKKDVINKDDLIDLESKMGLLTNVKFEHVNGHSGDYGNEQADKLAVEGANKII